MCVPTVMYSVVVYLIKSYGAPNDTGRCSVAQCYDNTWTMLAQSKIKWMLAAKNVNVIYCMVQLKLYYIKLAQLAIAWTETIWCKLKILSKTLFGCIIKFYT